MTKKQPWYSEEAGYFGADYLMEYADAIPPEKTLAQVDFLEKTLCLQKGAAILDVPCGHGRHSVELAKRGYSVTGYELNQFFLDEAQKAANTTGVSLVLQKGDMRKLTYENEFDVALNLFTAMGYFEDDADDLTFFAGVYRSLKSGGQFVLDFMNRDWLIRNFKEKDWRELPDGTLLLIEHIYDPVRGRNADRCIKVRKGGSPEEAVGTTLRIYTTNELVKMGENVGFSFKEAFGDYEDKPLELGSRRTILHFEKK